ncbi:MAG: DMT family transporter [Solirubrobacterales bacterium]
MSDKRVYGLMVLTTLFWAGAFIAGKLSIAQFPPFALTFFRFLIALVPVFLILIWREPGNWMPRRHEWAAYATLGFIGIFMYHALFFTCLRYTTAVNSSLIAATNPMMVMLLAFLFMRERVTGCKIIGLLLSFGGVFLTVTNGDWAIVSGLRFNPGDLLMLAAVFCWAIYGILSRRMMEKYRISPLKVTVYTFLVCVLISAPLAWWETPSLEWGAGSDGWMAVVYMAIFPSVLGYLFNLIAIQRIGAPRAAVFINLVPVFTLALSALVLGDVPGPLKLVSAAIIIVGVYLGTRPDAPLVTPIKQAEESMAAAN